VEKNIEDLYKLDENGFSVLHHAVSYFNPWITKILLEKYEFDVN